MVHTEMSGKDRIILVVLMLSLGSIFRLFFEDNNPDKILRKEFAVTVINTTRNRYGGETVKLSNGSKMDNYFPKLNAKLMIGDSLVKRRKTTEMLVFRNKKLAYRIDLMNK